MRYPSPPLEDVAGGDLSLDEEEKFVLASVVAGWRLLAKLLSVVHWLRAADSMAIQF
jgi:hypothetical protein